MIVEILIPKKRETSMSKKTIVYDKQFDDDLSLSNKNLQAILKFYLFECPVPNTSERGKTFSYYGINKSPAYSRLKKALLDSAATSLKSNYKPCKKDELPVAFALVESLLPPNEYCVFLKYEEKNVLPSLFSAIRNAFAHGSFKVKSYSKARIYYLKNFDGYLKAEIVLHESTLLKWINCIKNFK